MLSKARARLVILGGVVAALLFKRRRATATESTEGDF